MVELHIRPAPNVSLLNALRTHTFIVIVTVFNYSKVSNCLYEPDTFTVSFLVQKFLPKCDVHVRFSDVRFDLDA